MKYKNCKCNSLLDGAAEGKINWSDDQLKSPPFYILKTVLTAVTIIYA
ncbi:MAG TPA: hypothetical protein VIH13_02140 [Candidatus Hydromicrobium sp.]